MIISTNNKINNTLTVETQDLDTMSIINKKIIDINKTFDVLDTAEDIAPRNITFYQKTFSNREYSYNSGKNYWKLRAGNSRKTGYESSKNSSTLINFKNSVDNVNSKEKNLIINIGIGLTTTVVTSLLTLGAGSALALIAGNAPAISSFLSLENAIKDADFYYSRVRF